MLTPERTAFFGHQIYLCLHIECHFESVHADVKEHNFNREFILFMEQLSTTFFILTCQYENVIGIQYKMICSQKQLAQTYTHM